MSRAIFHLDMMMMMGMVPLVLCSPGAVSEMSRITLDVHPQCRDFHAEAEKWWAGNPGAVPSSRPSLVVGPSSERLTQSVKGCPDAGFVSRSSAVMMRGRMAGSEPGTFVWMSPRCAASGRGFAHRSTRGPCTAIIMNERIDTTTNRHDTFRRDLLRHPLTLCSCSPHLI
jgi:hypothetical protein